MYYEPIPPFTPFFIFSGKPEKKSWTFTWFCTFVAIFLADTVVPISIHPNDRNVRISFETKIFAYAFSQKNWWK
jgi:hypothetical protein